MIRSAADFEIPNSGASWRGVKLVRQYAATSSTRSSSGRPTAGLAVDTRRGICRAVLSALGSFCRGGARFPRPSLAPGIQRA